MSDSKRMSAARFRARHAIANGLPGLVVGGLVAIHLSALADWDSDVLRVLLWSAAAAAALMLPLGNWMERRASREVVRALEAEANGTLDMAQRRRGHRAVVHLPLAGLVWHALCWPAAGAIVVLGLAIGQGEWEGFRSLVTLCGVLTGAAIVLPFTYYTLRRLAEPLQERWAEALSLDDQRQLGVVAPLRWKLVAPSAAICVAIGAFAALYTQQAALRPVEAHDLRVKAAFLSEAAEELSGGSADLAALLAAGRTRVATESLQRVEPARIDGLSVSARERAALRAAHAAGASHGDSGQLDTPNSLAWQRLPDGALLVAWTPLRALSGGVDRGEMFLWAFLLLALGGTLGVTGMLVRDVYSATKRLLDQLERVRSGDLRATAPLASDDELGVLGLAVGRMSAALRATLERAAEAADRVDEASRQTAEVGAAVTSASTEQRAGLERATASTTAIDQRARDIAESSEVLTQSVEEASSSVLELGAAAEQLNHTAQSLNGQVDEVSGSIAQMVRSVAHVGEHTQVLAEATLETSSSLSEMGESMRAVDGHAVETARLSTRVVELAESGRAHVGRTRDGMDAIRSATDSARQVIEGLSLRVDGIGKVVDVIDDVADETNLLALNAAIIAAQAGDQGKAFSVVADEIKDLADRVLSSTKEIAAQIRAVQEESANAAEAIRTGAARVREGVELSAGAGAALEEITAAARDCGQRTEGIVRAVQEQARATSHVGVLMERVNSRVGEIRAAGVEQTRATEVLTRSAVVMREVAHQTLRTTEEQARGSARIRDGMEAVRDVVDRIHGALREQSEACRTASSFLEQIHARTRLHEDAAQHLDQATSSLSHEASALRADLQQFRLGGEA
jgi:methyl-accepting chemotaxis protein